MTLSDFSSAFRHKWWRKNLLLTHTNVNIHTNKKCKYIFNFKDSSVHYLPMKSDWECDRPCLFIHVEEIFTYVLFYSFVAGQICQHKNSREQEGKASTFQPEDCICRQWFFLRDGGKASEATLGEWTLGTVWKDDGKNEIRMKCLVLKP